MLLLIYYHFPFTYMASLVAQMVKASAYNVGDPGSIPGWGRSLEKEMATHSQYSFLGNPMDRGAWQAAVHGVTKESETTWWLINKISL